MPDEQAHPGVYNEELPPAAPIDGVATSSHDQELRFPGVYLEETPNPATPIPGVATPGSRHGGHLKWLSAAKAYLARHRPRLPNS